MNALAITRARLGRILCLAAAMALTGCALMGGGGKPASLYQFGTLAAPDPPAPAVDRPIVILYAGSNFDRQSQGDRILTATGNRVAYIAEARWVAPARELFDTATVRELERSPVTLRVIRAGSAPKPDFVLAVAINRFDADYSSGRGVPEVVIEGQMKLMRVADRQIVSDRPVQARRAAQANRVTAIVDAFDQATADVTGQVAQFTMQSVRGG